MREAKSLYTIKIMGGRVTPTPRVNYGKAVNTFEDEYNAILKERALVRLEEKDAQTARRSERDFQYTVSEDERKARIAATEAADLKINRGETLRLAKDAAVIAENKLKIDTAVEERAAAKAKVEAEGILAATKLETAKLNQISGAMAEFSQLDPESVNFPAKSAEIGWKYPAVFGGEESKLPPLMKEIIEQKNLTHRGYINMVQDKVKAWNVDPVINKETGKYDLGAMNTTYQARAIAEEEAKIAAAVRGGRGLGLEASGVTVNKDGTTVNLAVEGVNPPEAEKNWAGYPVSPAPPPPGWNPRIPEPVATPAPTPATTPMPVATPAPTPDSRIPLRDIIPDT